MGSLVVLLLAEDAQEGIHQALPVWPISYVSRHRAFSLDARSVKPDRFIGGRLSPVQAYLGSCPNPLLL